MRRLSENQKLIASTFTQTIINKRSAIIYHSLFGNPNIITFPALKLFKIFHRACSLADVRRNFDIEGLDEAIQILIDGFFLNPEGFNERGFLHKLMQRYKKEVKNGHLINFLSLVMSEVCNFSCSYCFANKKLIDNGFSNQRCELMGFKTAQKAVDIFFELMKEHDKQDVTINFGGGEPLLNFKTILQVLSYVKRKYFRQHNITFVLNTNCSKITKRIASVLKQYKVSIAASLDGLKPGNDAVRIYRDGRGTFDDILKGWKMLKKIGILPDGFMVTVNQANFHLIDERLIDFVSANQMRDVRIDIDVIHQINIFIEDVACKLLALRRYAAKLGITVNGFWDRPLENIFNPSSKEFTAFCGGIRGNSLIVNPRGKVYLCGYSSEVLGDIFINSPEEIFGPESKYYQIVCSKMPGEILACRGCAIEGQCVGGCYVAFETERRKKNNVVARNCELYRIMTEELLKDITFSQ